MGWVKHDLNERKNDLGQLLGYIKLPLLPPSVSILELFSNLYFGYTCYFLFFIVSYYFLSLQQFIADQIETNPIFKDIRACQDLIMEALKYHLLPERRPLLQSPRTHPRKSTVGSLYAVGGMYAKKGELYLL